MESVTSTSSALTPPIRSPLSLVKQETSKLDLPTYQSLRLGHQVMPPHQLGPFSHPNTMQFPPTPYGLSPHSLGTHHAHLATHQMSHTSSHLPMNQHRSTSQYAARYHQKLITDDPLSTPRRPLQTDSSETGSSENGSSPDSETHEIPNNHNNWMPDMHAQPKHQGDLSYKAILGERDKSGDKIYFAFGIQLG